MKQAPLIITLMMLIFGVSFVSAIPKSFEVSNVFWATEGKIEGKSFLLGLVELSWDSEKGKTNSLIAYLDYDDKKYYSNYLGLIKDLNQLDIGISETSFYSLDTFASEKIVDKIPVYSLLIPISEEGKIKFDNVRLSKINQNLVIPESFRINQNNNDEPFTNLNGLVACSKSILFDSSSTEICDDDTMSLEEFQKCRDKNEKVARITFDCSLLCLKSYYQQPVGTYGECSIFKPEFVKSTSSSFNFNELTSLNKELETFNPWRANP
jgi:hypothetical protein